MTDVTGMAECVCPYCNKEFEDEVTIKDAEIEVEHEDVRSDLD